MTHGRSETRLSRSLSATETTVAAFLDPAKRPQTRQVPLPDWLFDFDINAVLPLLTSKLYGNLSGARLRVLLDDEVCTELLGSAAQQPAGALLPSAVLEGCRQNMSAPVIWASERRHRVNKLIRAGPKVLPPDGGRRG